MPTQSVSVLGGILPVSFLLSLLPVSSHDQLKMPHQLWMPLQLWMPHQLWMPYQLKATEKLKAHNCSGINNGNDNFHSVVQWQSTVPFPHPSLFDWCFLGFCDSAGARSPQGTHCSRSIPRVLPMSPLPSPETTWLQSHEAVAWSRAWRSILG